MTSVFQMVFSSQRYRRMEDLNFKIWQFVEDRRPSTNLNLNKCCYTATHIVLINSTYKVSVNISPPSKHFQQKTTFRRVLGLGNKNITCIVLSPSERRSLLSLFLTETISNYKKNISCFYLSLLNISAEWKFLLTNLLRKTSVNDLQIILIIERWTGSEMTESWS